MQGVIRIPYTTLFRSSCTTHVLRSCVRKNACIGLGRICAESCGPSFSVWSKRIAHERCAVCAAEHERVVSFNAITFRAAFHAFIPDRKSVVEGERRGRG